MTDRMASLLAIAKYSAQDNFSDDVGTILSDAETAVKTRTNESTGLSWHHFLCASVYVLHSNDCDIREEMEAYRNIGIRDVKQETHIMQRMTYNDSLRMALAPIVLKINAIEDHSHIIPADRTERCVSPLMSLVLEDRPSDSPVFDDVDDDEIVYDPTTIKYDVEARLLKDLRDPSGEFENLNHMCDSDMVIKSLVYGLQVVDRLPPDTLRVMLFMWMLLRDVYDIINRSSELVQIIETRVPECAKTIIREAVYGKRRLSVSDLQNAAVKWQMECPYCMKQLVPEDVGILSCCLVSDAGPFHVACGGCVRSCRVQGCILCDRSHAILTPHAASRQLLKWDPARYTQQGPTRLEAVAHAAELLRSLA